MTGRLVDVHDAGEELPQIWNLWLAVGRGGLHGFFTAGLSFSYGCNFIAFGTTPMNIPNWISYRELGTPLWCVDALMRCGRYDAEDSGHIGFPSEAIVRIIDSAA